MIHFLTALSLLAACLFVMVKMSNHPLLLIIKCVLALGSIFLGLYLLWNVLMVLYFGPQIFLIFTPGRSG